jgi:outer membrane protein assembly factor BamB
VLAAGAIAAVLTTSPSRTTSTSASGKTVPKPSPLPLPAPIPGYLLIADRGNNRILLVDNRKRTLWRYPAPGRKPSYPFYYDDDAFFGPDLREIISNQEDQHTIQIISFPAGKVLWHYGHPNVKGSAPGYLNTPDDAYLLPHGVVTVADAYNCRILYIDHAKRIMRQIGTPASCVHHPPSSLTAVNGGTPLPGGGILVSEITGAWVDAFNGHGQLMWSLQAPVSYPSDPQWLGDGKIMLADYARPGHVLILTRAGRVLWRYGPPSGPSMLDHPSLALPIGHGLIAVNDDYRHRVVLISIHRHRIIWQYGHTDIAGRKPGYLNTPDGLDLLPFRRALTIPAIRALLTRQHELPHIGAQP